MSKDFYLGELIICCFPEPLRHAGRKRKGAAIGEIHYDPPQFPVVANSRRSGLRHARNSVTLQRDVDLCICQFSHVFHSRVRYVRHGHAPYFLPTTIDVGPSSGVTFASWNPASVIQPMQSAPV